LTLYGVDANNQIQEENENSKIINISNEVNLKNVFDEEDEAKHSCTYDQDYFELECQNEELDFEVVQAQPSEVERDDAVGQSNAQITQNEPYNIDSESDPSRLNTDLISEEEEDEDENDILNVSESLDQSHQKDQVKQYDILNNQFLKQLTQNSDSNSIPIK